MDPPSLRRIALRQPWLHQELLQCGPAFAAANPSYGAFSSLLSDGNTLTGGGGFASGAPEPTTWPLLIFSLSAIGWLLREHVRINKELDALRA
ncbi:MAG: hypothetical protein JO303_13030 [Caulobacteraceae bacterium]|nr:hypothetical protein [Caulobacteraceae bacterium]